MSVKFAIACLVALSVVGAVAYAALEPVEVFGVSSTGLEGSINRELEPEAQNPAELECEERSPRAAKGADQEGLTLWTCRGRQFGSVEVASTVAVDEDGCWRIVGGFDGEFDGRSACINLWDATGSPLF